MAIGRVIDGIVRTGTGVFVDGAGRQLEGEYHLSVKWECRTPMGKPLSAKEAASMGYKLPVRSVFAKLKQGDRALVLEKELRLRGSVLGA
jgi:hypothetical protein